MPLPTNIDEISSLVKQQLNGTAYQCTELIPLSGGNANYVFHGRLAGPLSDGTTDVLIKHGEAYVSSNHSFELPTSRCTIEAHALVSLGGLAPSTNPWCSVRTPKLWHFDHENKTQVQEYLPMAIDLKNYALKYYVPQTLPAQRDQCLGIGHGLGRWLRSFHEWAVSPDRSRLRTDAAQNEQLQKIKHMTYYDYLIHFIDRFPSLLSDSKAVFDQVKAMAEAELEDDAALQVVHGDFWTGNALLPDKAIEDPTQAPVFVVDWEVVSLGVRMRDVGQMIAELYMLKLFKGADAGSWLVEGYLAGYGAMEIDQAFRTALHVGCHLIVIGGSVAGWGSDEDVTRVVAFGRDMIIKAWEKDAAWFRGGPLESMFGVSGSN